MAKSETAVAACAAAKGRPWSGALPTVCRLLLKSGCEARCGTGVVAQKRQPLLGRAGVVLEVDTVRGMARVGFGGGVEMWWAAGYLLPAGPAGVLAAAGGGVA